MKLLTTALFASMISLGAAAQSSPATTPVPAPPAKEVANDPAAMPKDMAVAEVRKVDKDAKKVTLKHGPIKNLDMPAMTMVFQVRDATLLDKLAAGDTIKFTAEQLQGAYVVTSVQKVAPK